jgi:hypothetical protein
VTSSVVIGMDPHKRSAAIEVMAGDETVLGGRRFATDAVGFLEMVKYAKQWPARRWAVEGSNGSGRHIVTRLVADGEVVVDVPPEAGCASTSVHQRPGPRDRYMGCALGRSRRHPDERSAPGR